VRRQLGKELKRQFKEQLRVKLPQFGEVKIDPNRWGWKVFEWAIAPGMKAYVCLFPSQKDDAFTVDIAWSRQGRFPRHLDYLFPHDIPRARIFASEPVDGEYLTRLPYLYSDRDQWWEVIPRLSVEEILEQQRRQIESGQVEEAPIEAGLERIEPLVTDAVNRIVEYGVPWLVEQCGQSRTV
jgi:hypothetical protein